MDSLLGSLFVTVVATAGVLAFAYVFLRVLKRYQIGTGSRGEGDSDALEFVRSLPLGTRERVTVVRYRGETFMLGVAGGNVTLIRHWAAGETPDLPAREPPPPE
ncbi:flagellar biosynthetic protein FliO [Pacificimonas sp. WHA3]|uniref:Flagellar biosynthetic protein FliO n=1 Tax=Pacificimonas pallii TaxID=2827236 RepID=A0ABS6SGB5_9SPHN|nr:flagellar biosynthetic protein FliO [Pacificimonas pallii]MBV7256961.1 flagellar biosynthetic protein FliO [Pacificimonas pallii]